MHEVLVNRLGGLSLPRVVRLTDRPDMTLDVHRGLKTTIQPTTNLKEIINLAKSTIKPFNEDFEQSDITINSLVYLFYFIYLFLFCYGFVW